jgi:GDP-L-fucose synthase
MSFIQTQSKIFVAGHRGMVGSAVVRRLKQQGFNNLVMRTHAELDLLDHQAVQQFFAKEQFDCVVLAAATVGGILANATYPADFIYDNLTVQNNVIHEAWRSGVKNLLFLGSSCIYPKLAPQPMKEEHLLTGPLEPTNEPYAIAKIAGIKMCEAYNRQYGTDYFAIMPTNLYGPGDSYGLQDSHVLPALIRKMHEAKCGKQDSVMLWGTGTSRREFLHCDDLAAAIVFLLTLQKKVLFQSFSPDTDPLINVGYGKDITIFELAKEVKRITAFPGEIKWDSTKPDGTPQKLLDTGRINNLGWKPTTSLSDGIRSTYLEYCNREEV